MYLATASVASVDHCGLFPGAGSALLPASLTYRVRPKRRGGDLQRGTDMPPTKIKISLSNLSQAQGCLSACLLAPNLVPNSSSGCDRG